MAEKETSDELLESLGRKVRALRAGRGMTRKMLAADSAVSERYLAQLEQGKGKISIGVGGYLNRISPGGKIREINMFERVNRTDAFIE